MGAICNTTHDLGQLQFALQGPEEVQTDAGTAGAAAAVEPATAGVGTAVPRRHEPWTSHDPLPHHHAARHVLRACNTPAHTNVSTRFVCVPRRMYPSWKDTQQTLPCYTENAEDIRTPEGRVVLKRLYDVTVVYVCPAVFSENAVDLVESTVLDRGNRSESPSLQAIEQRQSLSRARPRCQLHRS